VTRAGRRGAGIDVLAWKGGREQNPHLAVVLAPVPPRPPFLPRTGGKNTALFVTVTECACKGVRGGGK
jgi:hypothetical protein